MSALTAGEPASVTVDFEETDSDNPYLRVRCEDASLGRLVARNKTHAKAGIQGRM